MPSIATVNGYGEGTKIIHLDLACRNSLYVRVSLWDFFLLPKLYADFASAYFLFSHEFLWMVLLVT